jgi:hypothetical protein
MSESRCATNREGRVDDWIGVLHVEEETDACVRGVSGVREEGREE